MTHPRFALLVMSLLGLVFAAGLQAQCALANPSFELAGTGGVVFRGWEQFGSIGSTDTAWHGSAAARVSGQDTGAVNESGYWQQLACAVGERWRIAGHVLVPASSPLTGASLARIKVEWFDAGGAFIDLDTYAVADASSPQNHYLAFDLLSEPAPAGTAALRLVLGVLQSPGIQTADVCYDQITCYSTSAPTIDDAQWVDFPGGRALEFSQRTWRVKGPGFYGPGPNNFSDSVQSVWVDTEDRLHLTIRSSGGTWYSTEVTLADTLGYGDYIFTTVGAVDQLGLRVVLGLFLWQYSTCWDPGSSWWNPYNEFDIEYSLWGTPGNQVGQFVAQPWDWAGNIFRYDAAFGATEVSSHAIRWLPDRVECRAWRGGPDEEATSTLITSWTYTGPHIPRPEQPRVHINLWYFGDPPSAQQEVIISRFTHVPPGGGVGSSDPVALDSGVLLCQNYPNPFQNTTDIVVDLARSGPVRLDIFDIKGRKVATLLDTAKAAGRHQVVWNAQDNPSGIYFCRVSAAGVYATHRMLLVK